MSSPTQHKTKQAIRNACPLDDGGVLILPASQQENMLVKFNTSILRYRFIGLIVTVEQRHGCVLSTPPMFAIVAFIANSCKHLLAISASFS